MRISVVVACQKLSRDTHMLLKRTKDDAPLPLFFFKKKDEDSARRASSAIKGRVKSLFKDVCDTCS